MRFHFDLVKSQSLRGDPTRRIGFEEVKELFEREHYLDFCGEDPPQYRAIGWVAGQLYTVIYEVREDFAGEYYHLVTLWRATRNEREIYAGNS